MFLDKMMEKQAGASVSPFHLELDKRGKRVRCTVSGIISVSDLLDNLVILVTHSGRVMIRGEGIVMSVYNDRIVELSGIISGVEFLYGKN